MYETAPVERKPAAIPMTPAIPTARLAPSGGARLARLGLLVVLGAVVIGSIFVLAGSSRPTDTPPAPAPPPREVPAALVPAAPPPPVVTPAVPPPPALTRADVRRQLFHLTKRMRALDASPVEPQKLGPLWRDLLDARSQLESPDADLRRVAERLDALEAAARELAPGET